jgi:Myb-like DNA-binding domain
MILTHVRFSYAQGHNMSSSQYDDDSKKGAWTPEEDEQLKELVAMYGPKGWSVIAKDVPGRSGKSCRLRCVHLPLRCCSPESRPRCSLQRNILCRPGRHDVCTAAVGCALSPSSWRRGYQCHA